MARKEPTFEQLYDYITREHDYDENYCFTQNFILKNRGAILKEFERSASLLAKRKNGNYLYHEIISITRAEGISEKEQKEKLMSVVRQYAQSRARDCLVFGGLHIEKDNNLHYHLIVSANELNQSKRYRLSKKQFSEVKIGLETHVLKHIPELEQTKLISADKKYRSKTSNKEQELKRRTGKPSQKDLFRDKLERILGKARNRKDLDVRLDKADIECYLRGKTVGFLDRTTQRKHRLKTLGLVAEYEAVIEGKKRDFGSTAEWLKGDFSGRDKKARKQYWRKQDNKDKKVKDRTEQTTTENITETANEWVFGDFSSREARERQAKSKERLDKYRQQKEDEREKQALKEALKEEKIKQRKQKLQQQRTKSHAQQEQSSDTQQHKQDWAELHTMIDFLGFADKILSALSLAKSGVEIIDEDVDSQKQSKTEEQKREDIAKQRKEAMQHSRAQASEEDQDEIKQKRWTIQSLTQTIKTQVKRTLRWLNNFIHQTRKQYVNQKRV